MSKPSDTFVPTCYAPVAPTWPGRTQRLGRLSRAISDGSWNAQPLPGDFDPMFFQAASADQNVREIRADERIVLENLHAEHPRLVTSLPDLRPRAIADRATGEREEIALVGDTLLVDTDRGVCCVVWRGRMGLRSAEEAGRIAVWVDALPMVAGVGTAGQTSSGMDDEHDVVKTIIGLRPTGAAPALPFVSGSSRLAQSNTFDAHPTNGTENDGTGTMFVSIEKLGVKTHSI
ncbi:MAG: DUF2169 domain-containing protein [Polyangiaceae bacterium]|nr:DUF2169 domain-containing protein [Polyangiaceae bacterium]